LTNFDWRIWLQSGWSPVGLSQLTYLCRAVVLNIHATVLNISVLIRSIITQLEKLKQSYDVQSYAGSSSTRPQKLTSLGNHATVTVFISVWPWHLSFWTAGQRLPGSCRRVYVQQVWRW